MVPATTAVPRFRYALPGRVAFAPRPADCPSPAPPTTGRPAGRPSCSEAATDSSPTTSPGENERRHALTREPDTGQQVVRPVPALHVDQAEGIRARRRRPPRAGQPVHEEGVDVDDPAGAPDRLGLVLAQPEQLVQRRGGVGRLAGEPVHVVRAELLDLAGGPDVHPDDGGPHGAAVFVETGERLALVRQQPSPRCRRRRPTAAPGGRRWPSIATSPRRLAHASPGAAARARTRPARRRPRDPRGSTRRPSWRWSTSRRR